MCGLLLDMGLGKTVSTLTAIQDLLIIGDIERVLVIAPKRVAEDTWSTECEKWDHLNNLKISKILGTLKQRQQAIEVDADIYVINRENVSWLVNNYYNDWKWDCLVIDEFSSFKSSKSQRFRSLKKVIKRFKRVIGLTGTPAPNNLIDLWPQIYLLDQGKRLGRTLTSYRETYFTPGRSKGYVVFDYRIKPGAEEEIYKRIGDICISMKAKDYLKLPDVIYNEVQVEIPEPNKALYKELKKDLIVELDNSDIIASNAAVLSNKLLQMANGAIYDEDKNIVDIHDEKLKKLLDIIEAANGNSVLVFYTFKHDLKRILTFLQAENINAEPIEGSNSIKRWNEGKIQVMLCHPASAGHGLNLQYGGHIMVWFGLTWSLELYQQANARLYRQGQKEVVTIHHIIAKDTIDEDVMAALKNKEVNQDRLIEAVKARVKEYY